MAPPVHCLCHEEKDYQSRNFDAQTPCGVNRDIEFWASRLWHYRINYVHMKSHECVALQSSHEGLFTSIVVKTAMGLLRCLEILYGGMGMDAQRIIWGRGCLLSLRDGPRNDLVFNSKSSHLDPIWPTTPIWPSFRPCLLRANIPPRLFGHALPQHVVGCGPPNLQPPGHSGYPVPNLRQVDVQNCRQVNWGWLLPILVIMNHIYYCSYDMLWFMINNYINDSCRVI